MLRILLATAVLLVAGCMYPQVQSRPRTFDEHIPAPRTSYSGGSLWQESSAGLTDDFKARKRGDVVTIVVAETASASKEANTKTGRGTSISAGIPNFMGVEATAIAKYLELNNMVSASTDSKYDGSGSTSRKDILNATITAQVTDVLPNGNLRIEGQRSVRVNNEEQIIILEGIVRPRDISQDNMVSSAMIADARITYSGNGVVNDRQQPGWLLNFIDKVWPF